MARSRRGTDTLLTLLALLILLLPYVAGVFGNDLPQLLPDEVRTRAPLYFATLLVVMLAVMVMLARIRREMDEGGPRTLSRRLRRRNVALTLALGVLGAALGVLSGLVVPTLPELAQANRTYGPWLSLVLPLVALALLIVLPLMVDWLDTRASLEKKDRAAFLHQLARRYDAYLDDPLQRAVRAALGILDTPSVLSRPTVTIETLSDDVPGRGGVQTLAPDVTLRAVYEVAGGQLLILGAPGAGKSTQLHELGRELVKQAQGDTDMPMPVILDLSTWTSNHDPLGNWLVDAIVLTYRLDPGVARRWVDAGQVAPLLDALDVMGDDDRPRCVQAINDYRAAHPARPLVVCSRLEEYERIGATLGLRRAVTLQPLSDAAIDEALAIGGAKQATLRTVVAQDSELRDALRTPLILSLVVLTYSDLRGEEIPSVADIDSWRRELFSRYIQRLLGDDRMRGHQPGGRETQQTQQIHYTEQEFKRTLAWLGYELRVHNMGAFYMERLQTDWLPNDAVHAYHVRLRRGIFLLLGLVFGSVFGLAFGLATPLPGGLVGGLVGGLIYKLVVGLLCVLVGLLFFASLGISSDPIEPVAQLRWSRRGMGTGLIGLLILGLVGWLFSGITGGLVYGLFGMLFGLYLGLESQHVDEQDLRQPNEGIHRSVRSALFVGLLVGLFCGLTFGLLGWLGNKLFSGPLGELIIKLNVILFGGLGGGLVAGLATGLVFGLTGVLGGGLVFGGEAALKHLVVRLALRASGIVPPALPRFLDEASSLVLLRRVGGGYQFIHQLLRDYFADQYTPPKP